MQDFKVPKGRGPKDEDEDEEEDHDGRHNVFQWPSKKHSADNSNRNRHLAQQLTPKVSPTTEACREVLSLSLCRPPFSLIPILTTHSNIDVSTMLCP